QRPRDPPGHGRPDPGRILGDRARRETGVRIADRARRPAPGGRGLDGALGDRRRLRAPARPLHPAGAAPDARRGPDVTRWLRAFDPQLPGDVWLLQVGGVLNSFGNGVVLPFLVIYLHDVRGFGLGISGLIVAVSAAAQLSAGV